MSTPFCKTQKVLKDLALLIVLERIVSQFDDQNRTILLIYEGIIDQSVDWSRIKRLLPEAQWPIMRCRSQYPLVLHQDGSQSLALFLTKPSLCAPQDFALLVEQVDPHASLMFDIERLFEGAFV